MMAEAMPENGRLISCEIDPVSAEIAQKYFNESPYGHKIEILLGPALETLKTLRASFDLVFIDADKGNYPHYYELCLPMVRQGGLIVADNMLREGKVLNPESPQSQVIKDFNDFIQQDERVDNVCLTVRDGIMLMLKR